MHTVECDLPVSFPVGTRIVFVFHGSEQGGAEHQGLLLAAGLREHYGAEVMVFGLMAQQPGRVAQRCCELDIPWKAFPLSWPNDFSGRVRSLFKLTLALRALQPAIILPYTYLPNVLCSLIWKLTGARLCIWNQRDEGRYLEKSFLNSLAIDFAPVLVANATVGKEFLENQFDLRGKKVRIIYNAILPPKQIVDRETCRSVYGLNTICFVATMVANIHSYKDHGTLLKAWKLIIEDKKGKEDQPVLLLAGRFAGMELELDALIRSYGLHENVKLIGEVRDINSLLSASDLYLHSSKTEGMPNAVLEAMSIGLPVVATDIPGIREAVGVYGKPYLCPVGDSKRMAELIQLFYSDVTLRKSHGEKMQKSVARRHDLQKMVSSMVKILLYYSGLAPCKD